MLKEILLSIGGFFQKLVDKTAKGIKTNKNESEKIQEEWEELKEKGKNNPNK